MKKLKRLFPPIIIVAGGISASAMYSAINHNTGAKVPHQISPSKNYQYSETIRSQLSDVLSTLQENRTLVESYKKDTDIKINKLRQNIGNHIDNEIKTSEIDSEVAEEDTLDEGQATELAIAEEEEAYESEFVDFSWAPDAENNIDNGLSQLKDDENIDFEIIGSVCKTTRCVATVEFRDYESAIKDGNRFAEMSFPGLNCAQSVYLPEPDDVSANYQANLMLDCSQQNQGLVRPIN